MIGGIERVRDGIVAGCGVHRDRRGGPSLPEEKWRYGLLMAHVGRTFQVADRLGPRETALAISQELLERLDIGFVLPDADARPLLLNTAAEDHLRRGAGPTVCQGRIRATEPNVELGARIGEAAQTSGGRSLRAGGVVRLQGPDGGLPILIAPFRSEAMALGPGAPAAVMIFEGPRARSVHPDAIADVFGLTPAEARIVADLVRGKSLVTFRLRGRGERQHRQDPARVGLRQDRARGAGGARNGRRRKPGREAFAPACAAGRSSPRPGPRSLASA